MRQISTVIASLLSAITVSLTGAISFAQPAAASTQDFHFSEFRAVYHLNLTENGTTMDVHETLVAEFPNRNQNKGIVREIPRTNQGGRNIILQDLRINVLRNGETEPIWSLERKGQWFEVATGTDDYLRGTQRYELFYQFKNVIADFGGHQELYWDSNGTAWQQRFDRLSATIILPEQAATRFMRDTRCFVGVYGSTNNRDCETTISPDSTTITFTATRPLQPGENLTFALAFDPGTFIVHEPEIQTSFMPFTAAVMSAGLSSVLLLAMIVLYRKRISQPKKLYKPAFTPPQYLPPKELSLAAAATLTSKAAGSTVSAQLLDMAVR
ncbi:DUF2207 domain-containing protein, partial [Candidatus Saccharibacteria bacterium]|nr:DUF2207 domain-containing protein [Candidatus Saccharibacteria bacterium]